MTTRIGVDVGGTFTDLVIFDELTGETAVAKGPSTPDQPEVGVLKLVTESVAPQALRRASHFLHGTTVGLNALLEHRGARVGMLTTQGFRDVLELRRGRRAEIYDLHYQPMASLVPRRLRVEVDERTRFDGKVERQLVPVSLAKAVEQFEAESVESVAVCYINSYANPENEIATERALRDLGFEGAITLSHRLSREMREFERASTSVVDAYVRPVVSNYLRRLDEGLRDAGFAGQSLITRSGGGAIPFPEAESRPFETVMSGPVAGVVGAADLLDVLGFDRGVTADVGGTSFDTSLLVGGSPIVKYEGQVGDLPLQTSWVDVRSIGSGGGSIAYVDESELLRVGPESSGAVPGPICYGRGGTRPTTTDAAAVLGMLASGNLAGGLQLDIRTAEKAFDALAETLGLNRDTAASGVLKIASAAMAGAVRAVTIEQGEDPRAAALIAYGGAGPMLATAIADELEMSKIVVPQHAGNFSASGLLSQDITRTASASLIRPLSEESLVAARGVADDLQQDLESRIVDVSPGSQEVEISLELRFAGQFYSLAVPWVNPTVAAGTSALLEQFTGRYGQMYGHTIDGPVEIVAVRVTLRDVLPSVEVATTAERVSAEAPTECEAFSFALQRRVPFAVVDRDTIGAEPIGGPMIVVEPTTTTYVDVGWWARRGNRAALLITREEVVK